MKKSFNLSKQHLLLCAVMLLGCAIRLVFLGEIPGGLNQDEASIGYEAFSLLYYGIDRNGIENPVHLLAWGSGQNIVYAWLCMPFVALLGLSVFSIRLPMAIAGCISIYAFYLLFKLLWNEKHALFAAFFFAVFPWHIIKSRWALDCNIFPDLVLWGVVLLLYYIKQQRSFLLYLSVLILSLACYSYGTAYLFMPFFVGGVWLYMLYSKKITPKHFAASATVFFAAVLPIMLFVLINITDLEQIKMLGFTIPKMYQQRFSAVTGTGDNFFTGCLANLKNFWNVLLNQGDWLWWNSLENYGICYLVFIPLIPLGIIISFFNRAKAVFVMHWWFVCALLVVMVSEVNVNHVNIVFIPVAYYISLALVTIAKQHKALKMAAICLCLCLFGLFCKNYFTTYDHLVSMAFFDSYDDALQYAESFETEKIYISTDINQPYMLTLFYAQTNPHTYIETRQMLWEKVAFEQIKSFDRYYFYLPSAVTADKDAAYIVNRNSTGIFDPQHFDVTHFEYYSVAVSKNIAQN